MVMLKPAAQPTWRSANRAAKRTPISRPMVISVTRHGNRTPARKTAVRTCDGDSSTTLREFHSLSSRPIAMPSLRTDPIATATAASAGKLKRIIKPPMLSETKANAPANCKTLATIQIATKMGMATAKNERIVSNVSLKTYFQFGGRRPSKVGEASDYSPPSMTSESRISGKQG